MKWMYLLLLCFTDSLGCRRKTEKPKYFSQSEWGGWIPKVNSSWMDWIEKWGNESSSVDFDSTEVDKDPKSGWPRYWKSMGKGNPEVPAPPWAYEPENYGRAYFCYLQPDPGTGNKKIQRWGFNPIAQKCQTFTYTGAGGNENNFWNKYTCEQACTGVPDANCYSKKIKFRDYIDE